MTLDTVSKNPLEDWFIKDEPVEIEVAGVRLKVREIPAGLYMHLASQAVRNNKFDADAYINSLVKEMVIMPEFTNRDLARLKPGIKAKLMKELEILLGVSPEALKNDLLGLRTNLEQCTRDNVTAGVV